MMPRTALEQAAKDPTRLFNQSRSEEAPACNSNVPLDPPAHYAAQSALTAPGRHAPRLDALPADPAAIARIVQGLMIHEHATDFYGAALPEARRAESHIRSVEGMLDAIMALDGRPLAEARPPERRLVGTCRNFTVLMVAMLRAKGMPARARCGFGAYFSRDTFEDHWVCEYWIEAESRWALADPQFDAIWIERLGIGHEVMDVPRDRFLVAGDAWTLCRKGGAAPARFGIVFSGLRGLWFVAGDLVRDLAALNRVEALPWDVWGAQPGPGWDPRADELALFDRVAALTRRPDAPWRDLAALYRDDTRLAVPAIVRNALRQRDEPFPGP